MCRFANYAQSYALWRHSEELDVLSIFRESRSRSRGKTYPVIIESLMERDKVSVLL